MKYTLMILALVAAFQKDGSPVFSAYTQGNCCQISILPMGRGILFSIDLEVKYDGTWEYADLDILSPPSDLSKIRPLQSNTAFNHAYKLNKSSDGKKHLYRFILNYKYSMNSYNAKKISQEFCY